MSLHVVYGATVPIQGWREQRRHEQRVHLSFRIFKIRDITEITRQCTRKMGGGSYLPHFTVL
jgi:hypothetical protein